MWCPAAVMRRCLDIDNVPGGEDFFARQGGLTQKYVVYFKSNRRIMAGEGPSFGQYWKFQTSPKSGYSYYMGTGGRLSMVSRILLPHGSKRLRGRRAGECRRALGGNDNPIDKTAALG